MGKNTFTSMKILESKSLVIHASGANIVGHLHIPENHKGLVVFSHGSGSSRYSPRNRFVSELLNQHGFATFLVDLLTEREDADEMKRFDISLLTHRLLDVVRFFMDDTEVRFDRIALFGASTGSASALRVAAMLGDDVFAVVSRGGRPDLAYDALDAVISPTLLIVGGNDSLVLGLNKRAMMRLRCEKKLVVVPGATHLFEERGAMEMVARESIAWFELCLQDKDIRNAFSKS